MTDSIRAALERLVEAVEDYGQVWGGFSESAIAAARAALAEQQGEGPSERDVAELFYRHMGEGSEVGFENAIAEALARWGHPAPQPPAEGEVAELAEWLHANAKEWGDLGEYSEGAKCHRAAELLQRQHPTPVPVSEEPWKRESWCDEQGRCWLQGKVEGDWRLMDPLKSGVPQLKYCFTSSLPAHALPMPQVEVQ
jgi:hypothetical protein